MGLRAWWIGCAAAVLLEFSVLPATAFDDGDRNAFRSAIEGQIGAFRVDDAERAYAFAAPNVRSLFPSASAFMEMVRGGYRPVYRPQRYEFGETRDTDSGPEQSVRIDDADGIGWEAIYTFERQADGEWRISGCRLVKARDQAV